MSDSASCLLSNNAETSLSREEKGESHDMMRIRVYPILVLALMGSMDCLTTVIGIVYLGAVEVNPLLAGVVRSNMPAFVALKLLTTAFVCLIFIQAEKMLMQTRDKSSKSFSRTRMLLKVANMGVIAFLCIVVTNNLLVLASRF